MKKNRCYPKYSYIVSFILATILLVFALGPIFIKTDDELYIKLIWSIFMFIFSLVIFINALILMQYYVIEDGRITVKTIFGTIISLNMSKCSLMIQNLPTFSSWIGVTYKKWICIYLRNNTVPLFKKGCCNNRKFKRIQIIYSKKNSAILSQNLESDIKKYLIN